MPPPRPSSSWLLMSPPPPLISLQLIIGDFGLSLDEQKAQMAMWAIFAAVSLAVSHSQDGLGMRLNQD